MEYDWVYTAHYARRCPQGLADFPEPESGPWGLVVSGRAFWKNGYLVELSGSETSNAAEENGTCQGVTWRYIVYFAGTPAPFPAEASTLLLLGSGVTTLAGWAALQIRGRRRAGPAKNSRRPSASMKGRNEMTKRTSLFLGMVVLLVAGALPMAAGAGARAAGGAGRGIAVGAAGGRKRRFFVKMAVEADLGAAFDMDWAARGEYVWQALGTVAKHSQAPVLAYARLHGLEAHSLVAANAVYVREGDLQAALDLAALPGVAYLRLEHFYPVEELAFSPEGEMSWGVADVKAPDVWALGYRGAGAKVASIDTGVQWDHPALAGQYGCPMDPGNPACWYDPGNVCGGAPCDNNGHGTHVTGTMAAGDDPAFAHTVGVAPDTTWIACKGCESSSCSEFALNACADWVLAPGGNPANRPDAVNNSWGGGGGDPWFQAKVQAWVAAGIFGGFASGGSGPGCATIGSPCDYPGAFCTTGHDENRIHGSFASLGPGAFGHDPYTKPNISAPGVNIWSTLPTSTWGLYSGTSMASPHSVGAVALVLSACPHLKGDVYGLFEVLQDNADPAPDGYCGAPPDGEGNYTYGYGYLNALNAVEACAVGSMHVGNITVAGKASGGQYLLQGKVPVVTGDGIALPGAAVSAQWTLPNGRTLPVKTALSNSSGFAKFQLQRAQTGWYQLCVTNLALNGYLYAEGDNVETCDGVSVP